MVDTQVKAQFDPTVRRMIGIADHGMTPFDVPFISEIADNLWQGGVESGLVLPRFFRHMVSLYQAENYKVRHFLDSEVSVRMKDSPEQSLDQVDAVAAWVHAARKAGPTLVHCQAGLNRSGLVVARVLMLNGLTAGEAIEMLREKRSPAVLCNPAFEEWLRAR